MAAREPRDLLKLLANPTNRTILTILASEPQYPRRLAEIVGLTEDEASKRLRLFEHAGLAEASWANVGKNVRLYRLTASKFTVSVDAGGLSVAGQAGAEPVKLSTVVEAPPAPQQFVGREAELGAIEDQLATRRAVCLVGIGGAGKSALAAAYARRSGRPLLWHTVASGESPFLLLSRLAANLHALEPGDRGQRLSALRSPEEEPALQQAVLQTLNDRGILVVLDRFEAAGEGAVGVVAGLARGLTDGRLLMTARAFPNGLPRDLVATFRLPGLAIADCERLLAALGARLDVEAMQEIFDRTRGHPLSLVLVAQVAGKDPQAGAESLLQESGIKDFLIDDVVPQLPEAERGLLYGVSVLRQPFLAAEAEAIAPGRHVAHALMRLEGRGLIGRAGDEYFLHDLVRGILADAAPDRKNLHVRAANALSKSGVPAKVLEAANHYLEAGASRDAVALVREEATRRTFRFSDMGLADAYREVLIRLVADLTTDAQARGACELELGILATFAGDAAEAHRRLDAAERAIRTDRDLTLSFLIARGRVRRLEGDLDGAVEDYTDAVKAAQGRDPGARLQALLAWAFLEEERDDDEAFRLYREAIDLAQDVADPRSLSVAYAGASRIGMRQRDDRYKGWAEESLRLARLTGYLRGEVSVYMTLTTHAMMSGHTDSGLEYSQRYLRIADQLGDPWLRACAINDQAMLLVAAKRFQDAHAMTVDAIRLAKSIKSVFFEFGARIADAEALLGLGRPKEALQALDEALRMKVDAWPLFTSRAWRCLAATHAALGDEAQRRHAEAEAAAWLAKAKKTAMGDEFLSIPSPSTPAVPAGEGTGAVNLKKAKPKTVGTRRRA